MARIKINKKNGDIISLTVDKETEKVFNKICEDIDNVELNEVKMIKMWFGSRGLIFDLKDVSDIEVTG